MRINYDFNDLEAFLAVKETGSFHLAAERLHLSQSAVTRRVQKLEMALDTILFERTTREVRPTLAAKRLEARAEAILDDAKETALAMRDESVAFEHQRNSVLTVAVLPTVFGLLVPDAIRIYRETGGVARFRFMDRNANGVAEAVAKGEADFGVCSIPELEPSTRFEPLFDDVIVLVVPRRHRLEKQEVVTWSEFSREDLIVPARGTGNRLLIDEAMARARLPLAWSCEVGRSTTALEMVAAGNGLALLPRSAVASKETQAFGYVPVVKPAIVRPVGLLTRVGQKSTSTEEVFKAILRDRVATLFPG